MYNKSYNNNYGSKEDQCQWYLGIKDESIVLSLVSKKCDQIHSCHSTQFNSTLAELEKELRKN